MRSRLVTSRIRSFRLWGASLASGLLLAACGGGGDAGGGGGGGGGSFQIGGSVSGLATGASVVLLNNGGNAITVSANGSFTFSTGVGSGAAYAVSVGTQPTSPSQTCTVTNGSGSASAAVTNVAVTCVTNTFTVGGTVSGLAGGASVVLANGGTTLSVTGNGNFAFPTPLTSGTAYAVTVQTQPANQVCSVTNGTGTVGSAAVTTVSVTCANNSYSVRGTITGLTGSGLVLQNNAGNNLAISAGASTFQFPALVAGSSGYAVTVLTQPSGPSQTCTVANGSGPGTGANVTNVAITCALSTFAINVNVTGLTGTGLVVRNNGTQNLTINANGTASFATPIVTGGAYAVTVLTQPTGNPTQTCSVVGSGSGTVGSSAVTVSVVCSVASYTIGFTVSGLSGTGLQLTNNGANTVSVSGNGSFTFTQPVASGGTYAVAVSQQPSSPTQTCIVGNGNGTVGSANVTNVTITCSTTTFTVGGTISGLSGTGLQLRNNGGAAQSVSGATFTLTPGVASGAAYSVTVAQQPTGPAQTCTVANGSGTIGSANVTNVAVTCRSRFAFISNESGSSLVASYSVGTNGGLANVSAIPVASNSVISGAHATGVAVASTTHVVVATDTDSQDGELQVYTLGSGGQLSFASRIRTDQPCGVGGSHPSPSGGPCGLDNQAGTGPISTAPETVVIHPNGRFVYVMDGVARGACTTTANPCSPPAGYPASGSRTIRRYTLNPASGTLTYNDQHYCEGFIALAIDPQGRFLWCTSYLERRIYEFRIDQSTGALTFGTGTFIGLSDGDILLGVDPNGQYVYGYHEGDHTIDSYSINQSTGHLTNLTDPGGGPNKVFGVTTSSLAVSANGRTLYSATSSGIVAYSLGSDGRIGSILGTYNPAGGLSGGWFRARIGIGSNGQFLYLQGFTDPTVRIFSINASTGVLTETADSPSALASGSAGVTQLSLQ